MGDLTQITQSVPRRWIRKLVRPSCPVFPVPSVPDQSLHLFSFWSVCHEYYIRPAPGHRQETALDVETAAAMSQNLAAGVS